MNRWSTCDQLPWHPWPVPWAGVTPTRSPKSHTPLALKTLRSQFLVPESPEEFILLHDICQRLLHTGFPNAGDAASLLLVCSRWEFYDDDVFTLGARTLQEGVHQIPLSQLCDVIYSLSSLQIRDALPLDSLDALCDELARRARDLSEADLVRLARGLLKLRHQHESLLAALGPVVAEQQTRMQSMSLCNLINVFSYFGGCGLLKSVTLSTEFVAALIAKVGFFCEDCRAVRSRCSKLQSAGRGVCSPSPSNTF